MPDVKGADKHLISDENALDRSATKRRPDESLAEFAMRCARVQAARTGNPPISKLLDALKRHGHRETNCVTCGRFFMTPDPAPEDGDVCPPCDDPKRFGAYK